jgi:hypothetical protein
MEGPNGLRNQPKAQSEDFVLNRAAVLKILGILGIVESATYEFSTRPIVGAPSMGQLLVAWVGRTNFALRPVPRSPIPVFTIPVFTATPLSHQASKQL